MEGIIEPFVQLIVKFVVHPFVQIIGDEFLQLGFEGLVHIGGERLGKRLAYLLTQFVFDLEQQFLVQLRIQPVVQLLFSLRKQRFIIDRIILQDESVQHRVRTR